MRRGGLRPRGASSPVSLWSPSTSPFFFLPIILGKLDFDFSFLIKKKPKKKKRNCRAIAGVCFLLVLVGANVYMYLRVARGGTASKEPAARFVPLPRPTTKLVRRPLSACSRHRPSQPDRLTHTACVCTCACAVVRVRWCVCACVPSSRAAVGIAPSPWIWRRSWPRTSSPM
jgi:hypothetical protein